MVSSEMSAGVSYERRSGLFAKRRALTPVSASALLLVSLAGAQSVLAQEVLEAIEVTGTRILRDGYEAPTPLTVIGVEELNAAAPTNVADFVNQLPSIAGSATPANTTKNISNGAAGINALNLRSLGSVRTLVLLDGQRSVGSQPTGIVDVNDFPQALIERVDIVTGGASAAYGSDALSGVVNFVLDKDFTGFKTEAQGGITEQGDDEQYKVSATFGTPLAGDRGHFLFSGEYSKIEGVYTTPRDWNRKGWKTINNPAYTPGSGLPSMLVVPGVNQSNATAGGIINSANLAPIPGETPQARAARQLAANAAVRGTAFGAGGAPYDFRYGSIVADPFMIGGESNDFSERTSLDPEIERRSLFARGSFELTESIEVFAQASWSNTEAGSWCCQQFNLGNMPVAIDNAFLPNSVRAELAPYNVAGVRMGTMHADLPMISSFNDRQVTRYVVGANGDFAALGTDWTWNAYYQIGEAKIHKTFVDRINLNFTRALDAVRNSSGNIVCRANIDSDPTNNDPSCVPYNAFGIGVNSPEAVDYVIGTASTHEYNEQRVASASINGSPFDLWAGPVSMAMGLEHRRESGGGYADPLSAANAYFAGNQAPTKGTYDVTEGFLETVVPLAKDAAFAEKLDFNAAIRYTDYSTSGEVVTWKVGATWSPISDVTFRATRSRDIRAPNRQELFQAGVFRTNNLTDPFNNNAVISFQELSIGNLELEPEKADTTGLGVVYQPSWAPGLSGSFDYYNIEIEDAIGGITVQEIVDRCFAGNQTFCDAITRDTVANTISQIRTSPFNLVTQKARGFDIEAGYRLPLSDLNAGWGGDVAFRVLATHFLENYSSNGINTPTDTAGQNTFNGPPDWIYRATLSYSNDPLTLTLIGRGVSSGVYDNSWIECTTGCPDSTPTNRTIDENDIAGAFYLDASVSYQFTDIGGAGDMELYMVVKNIADKDPPVVAPGPGGVAFVTSPNNPTFYDYLGRVYYAGVRFKM
jgi:iron complex outermembrane receptor protein